MAKKFYAVRHGRKPGIYKTWADCQAQVQGFKGAVFKGFETEQEAIEFVNNIEKKERSLDNLKEDEMAVYVDGSYNVSTKQFGYGIVSFTSEGKSTYCGALEGDYAEHRNVAGELLAVTEAMKLAVSKNMKKLIIFYDYAGIRHWALGEWKTNYDLTRNYKLFAEKIQQQISLEFVKVAAHTGDEFNEEADQLARKGCGVV